MSTIDLGPIRPLHKGNWSSIARYELLNIVRYNDSSWIAKATVPVGRAPSEDAYWGLISSDGADGTLLPVGTSSTYGKLKLEDAVNSNAGESSGTAATPKAVKMAYDKAEETFALCIALS